ncbi:MAG: hypothetical protein HY821_24065 [Acidobacteria bacterium]|nr:hypothetical protein [Acidobacteriota bacterium]
MTHKRFELVSAAVFLLIALGHLARLLLRTDVMVSGRDLPQWPSGIACLFLGYLAWQGFRLGRGRI